MNNLHEYNEFKSMKKGVVENINENLVTEGAQLFDDTWKVRMRVEIPSSLINSYVKKVKDETGEDPKQKWSEQEIAEEIAKYVTTSFMAIENLPASIVSSSHAQPTVQTQEEMPAQIQVQTEVDTEVSTDVPAQPQAQIEGQPQGQPQAQAPAQGAQGAAQTVPQTEAPTAQI